MRKKPAPEFFQLIFLREPGVPDCRVWRIFMLKAVEGTSLALRNKKMQGLPMPKAEHGPILVDQLSKGSDSVLVIRFVERRLAVSGDVEFCRPGRGQRNNTKEFSGEHRRVDQAFERNRREIYAAPRLARNLERTALMPVGRQKNRRLDH